MHDSARACDPKDLTPWLTSQDADRIWRGRHVELSADGRAALVIGVTEDLIKRFNAVDLVKKVRPKCSVAKAVAAVPTWRRPADRTVPRPRTRSRRSKPRSRAAKSRLLKRRGNPGLDPGRGRRARSDSEREPGEARRVTAPHPVRGLLGHPAFARDEGAGGTDHAVIFSHGGTSFHQLAARARAERSTDRWRRHGRRRARACSPSCRMCAAMCSTSAGNCASTSASSPTAGGCRARRRSSQSIRPDSILYVMQALSGG